MAISLDKLRKFPEILNSKILNAQGKESKRTNIVTRSRKKLSILLTFIENFQINDLEKIIFGFNDSNKRHLSNNE